MSHSLVASDEVENILYMSSSIKKKKIFQCLSLGFTKKSYKNKTFVTKVNESSSFPRYKCLTISPWYVETI